MRRDEIFATNFKHGGQINVYRRLEHETSSAEYKNSSFWTGNVSVCERTVLDPEVSQIVTTQAE